MLLREQGSNGKWYRPEWDVAYFVRPLLTGVCDQFDGAKMSPEWDQLFRGRLGVSDRQMVEVAASLARFIGYAAEADTETARDAFAKAGWFDLPFEARTAFLARVGHALLCSYFTSSREVIFEGSPQIGGMEQLIAAVGRMNEAAVPPGGDK